MSPQSTRRRRNTGSFAALTGGAILIAAAMGLIVGIVVVAQTIYASTADHIHEFGTLKAIGATNMYIYRIIKRQATVSAVPGYSLGLAISRALVRVSAGGDGGSVQEMLDCLQASWGVTAPVVLPADDAKTTDPAICSFDGDRNVGLLTDFVDFTPLVQLRRERDSKSRFECPSPRSGA